MPKINFSNFRVALIWGAVTLAVLVAVFLAAVGIEYSYARIYKNRIFPGVRVLSVRLDGMTKKEAGTAVQKAVDAELAKGLRFEFEGEEVQLPVAVPATDPDLAGELIHYDLALAIDRAFSAGRSKSWLGNALDQFDARAHRLNFNAEITIKDDKIIDALQTVFEDKIAEAEDARFNVTFSSAGEPLVNVENEKAGESLETEDALRLLRRQAAQLSFAPIHLTVAFSRPRITYKDLEELRTEATDFLQRPLPTFYYAKEKYPITGPILATWMRVEKAGQKAELKIDENAFGASLRELAGSIERPVQNGSLVVKDGKIESFVAGTQGLSINIYETLRRFEDGWPEETLFPVEVEITSGLILGEDPLRLGIKEIIGVGKSNFAGSPSNRRKNINLGVQKVNGTLIAPGEEFSLLKVLGAVDEANGWLPELVIKGNKTTPEFGGGLCQIGTTSFRGALDSGLDITMRQNHSYRVSYYEPAGTDATIYEPAPDFRFINDTKNHILVNAYVDGEDVIFEFWGSKDGRETDPIKPSIYNITPPPPSKLIETLELPPGQKKCTERAHAGADAELKYRVVYADGSVHEELFKSHYRPWQEVCLIGVEALSETATTTEQIEP
ncbi:VanW family protein [Patescibacteria group bacterium]|nr:VanW family protein [Patescibacteria group bacterium]